MKRLRIIAALLLTIYIFTIVPPAYAADSDSITIEAKAALLVDADTGYVLLSQNADERLYPASLTKIMTAMLAIENGNLDDIVTVSATALENLSIYGSTADLKVGEPITLRDLLYCTLVASANEACNVIAEHISGSVPAFVELMNQRAAELGCEDTNFANTHGLHDENHYTTANDVLKITKQAMTYPVFMDIVNTTFYIVLAREGYEQHNLSTTNYLMSDENQKGYTYSYARGIKTGHTTPAGMCLVSSAEKGEITLISVVMGAESVTNDDGTVTLRSFSETKRLFEWGFDNFSNETLVSSIEPIAEVDVGLSSEVDKVVVHADGNVEAMLPKGYDKDKVEKDVIIYSEITGEEVQAPVAAGQVLGELQVSYDGEKLGKVNLVASYDVVRSPLQYFFLQLGAFLSMPAIKALIAVIVVIIVAYIAFITIMYFRKRNKKSALGSTYKGSSRKKP